MNEQLLETKIDNLVCIKESEKEQMDRNGAEIEERKERMRQLDFMRHNEIQRIMLVQMSRRSKKDKKF